MAAKKKKPGDFKKPKPIRVDRNCLRCDRPFKAQGRFQRLCRPCRVVAEGARVFD